MPHAKILTAVCFLFTLATIRADIQEILKDRLDYACSDRYRKSTGKLYDLSPRFFHEIQVLQLGHPQTFTEVPLPDWEYVCGKVLQVADDGILLHKYSRYDFYMRDDNQLVFIRHFHGTVVDDSTVTLFARPAGRYSYTSTLGARSTIWSYDYGEIPEKEELEQLKTEAKQRAENYRRAVDTQNAADKITRIKHDSEGAAAAFKYAKEKATEGSGPFQLSLGKKYLKGEGTSQDLDQAKYWFECACTNNSSEASNMLRRISVPSP
jgi:hypothetical protein